MNLTEDYTCGESLILFHRAYASAHGWLSIIVCIFGTFANAMNIAVLTRREMRSPTNSILTGLAVADMLVMLDYIPYVIHVNLLRRPRRDTFSYGWAIFVLFAVNFNQVCHTISIWLTVMLAVWRYIAVAYPQKNREWCNARRSLITIGGAYVICPIICIPLYLNMTIKSSHEVLDENGNAVNSSLYREDIPNSWTNTTLYFVQFSDDERLNFLKVINFWIYSVVIKIIPCVALTVLSLRLIFALIEAKNRRQKLTSTALASAQMMKVERSGSCDNGKKRRCKGLKQLDKEKQTDRTTRMLLAVLMLFLFTEFPQGILGLLSVVLGEGFFNTCYQKLGDLMDILAMVNSAINFILYCAMSRQFRKTFSQLFCRWRGQRRWSSIPAHNDNNLPTGTNHTLTQVTQL